MTMGRKSIQIDRDKLRAEVRKLPNEYVFFMLDDAIELLPPAKLHKIAQKYLDVKRLRPDAEQATRPSLLPKVKRNRSSRRSLLSWLLPRTGRVPRDEARAPIHRLKRAAHKMACRRDSCLRR